MDMIYGNERLKLRVFQEDGKLFAIVNTLHGPQNYEVEATVKWGESKMQTLLSLEENRLLDISFKKGVVVIAEKVRKPSPPHGKVQRAQTSGTLDVLEMMRITEDANLTISFTGDDVKVLAATSASVQEDIMLKQKEAMSSLLIEERKADYQRKLKLDADIKAQNDEYEIAVARCRASAQVALQEKGMQVAKSLAAVKEMVTTVQLKCENQVAEAENKNRQLAAKLQQEHGEICIKDTTELATTAETNRKEEARQKRDGDKKRETFDLEQNREMSTAKRQSESKMAKQEHETITEIQTANVAFNKTIEKHNLAMAQKDEEMSREKETFEHRKAREDQAYTEKLDLVETDVEMNEKRIKILSNEQIQEAELNYQEKTAVREDEHVKDINAENLAFDQKSSDSKKAHDMAMKQNRCQVF